MMPFFLNLRPQKPPFGDRGDPSSTIWSPVIIYRHSRVVKKMLSMPFFTPKITFFLLIIARGRWSRRALFTSRHHKQHMHSNTTCSCRSMIGQHSPSPRRPGAEQDGAGVHQTGSRQGSSSVATAEQQEQLERQIHSLETETSVLDQRLNDLHSLAGLLEQIQDTDARHRKLEQGFLDQVGGCCFEQVGKLWCWNEIGRTIYTFWPPGVFLCVWRSHDLKLNPQLSKIRESFQGWVFWLW